MLLTVRTEAHFLPVGETTGRRHLCQISSSDLLSVWGFVLATGQLPSPLGRNGVDISVECRFLFVCLFVFFNVGN